MKLIFVFWLCTDNLLTRSNVAENVRFNYMNSVLWLLYIAILHYKKSLKNDQLAYHLIDLRVPLVVRIPPVENHCIKLITFKELVIR